MYRYHCFFIGFVFLVSLASGCSKTTPVAVENLDSPDSNIPPISPATSHVSAPSLAPILPGTQVAVVPTPPRPARMGLTVLDSHTHHFGEVRQNTQLQHDFVLTNKVDVPIRILGMQSSCSCTWSESNDNFVGSTLAPGHKVDFPVFINTGTYQDKANGKINIIYRYQSDDPKWLGEEILTLEVTATILPDYRIEPQELKFGDILALESQTAKRSFRVTPVQMEMLEIIDIKPSSGLFTANIVSSGQGYEIEVAFDGSSLANSETVHGHLIIDTNSVTVPRGIVMLAASYVAPISTEPSYILISSDKEGIMKEKVQVVSSVPSQIRSVGKSSTDLVHVEFDSALKAEKHTITFTINPCRDAAIDETIPVEIVLFPAGRESIIQAVPVTLYRFYKAGE